MIRQKTLEKINLVEAKASIQAGQKVSRVAKQYGVSSLTLVKALGLEKESPHEQPVLSAVENKSNGNGKSHFLSLKKLADKLRRKSDAHKELAQSFSRQSEILRNTFDSLN